MRDQKQTYDLQQYYLRCRNLLVSQLNVNCYSYNGYMESGFEGGLLTSTERDLLIRSGVSSERGLIRSAD